MEKNNEMGFDLRVDNFRTQLINIINNANLPPSIIFFVLKDTLIEVNNLYTSNAQQQYKQFCEKTEEESE